MAFDFPSSPTVGQQFTPVGGVTYTWNGYAWAVQSPIAAAPLAIRVFITGSGTYIPTSGTAVIIVEMVGGGGGGAGGLGSGATSGGNGITSTFSGLSALGGVGGTTGPAPGAGGGTSGTGTSDVTSTGGCGGNGDSGGQGGAGGASAFGGQSYSSNPGARGAGGAGGGNSPGTYGGGGGGAGGYLRSIITSLTTSYSYTVGAGGNAGAAGSPNGGSGAAGNAGIIVVTEYGPIAGGVAVTSIGGPPQGRLTLQSGVPVMTTTQAAKTTLYYTPYNGNLVPLYNGSLFVMTPFNELSVATTDTVNSPSAIGASKVNDWFVWDSGGGVLRLVHGPDWTSDTVRSAGTALVIVNGIWLNAVAITNGPAIQRGTYVGTTRSNASSQLDWIYGGAAAGGSPAILGVWNCYNRVNVATTVQETASNWTQVATGRPFNNSTGNRVSAVVGLAEDVVQAQCWAMGYSPSNFAMVGISTDNVNIMGVHVGVHAFAGWAGVFGSFINQPFGYTFWQMMEAAGDAAGQWAGYYTVIGSASGMQLTIKA